MKIVHKLFIAPTIAMTFLIIIGVMAYLSMQQQDRRLQDLKENTFEGFRIISTQTIALGQVNAEIYANIAIMASMDEAAITKLTKGIEQKTSTITNDLQKLRTNPSTKQTVERILPILAKYKTAVLSAIDLASMDPNTGIASMQTATKEFKALRSELDSSLQRLENETSTMIATSKASNQTMLWIIGTCLLAACLAQIISSIFVARGVTRPLNQAIEIAQTVAAGRLDQTIAVNNDDEIGLLLQALKDMSESLAKALAAVHQSANSIAVASNEIASGNFDLSNRTEAQSISLHGTTSAMSALTSTVQRNDEHAHQANELATRASETAVKGGAVVAQVIDSMAAINHSSKRIADIISVIDSIAFQTNILALNAAVEAARAGEQGRGFAVVASEVRGLAQRSASAAKEITALIHESEAQVSIGSKLVDQAGETMNEVVASIQRVTTIMSEITTDSHEQSERITQVNQAIMDMDETTQQNSALVEQASAATHSMKEETDRLIDVISVFHLHDEHKKIARSITPNLRLK